MNNLVVKPKATKQENSQSKSDILKLVNPVDLDAHVEKVKHIQNGGMILSVTQEDLVSKLQEAVTDKLSSKYDVNLKFV